MPGNIIKLVVESHEFKFWSSFKLNRNIDTLDTFEFDAPYGENAGIKDIIKPLEFKPCQIFIDDRLATTAVIISVLPTIGDSNSVSVNGYAKPGVMNDCSISHENYPIEYRDQTLKQIADDLGGAFGVESVFTANSGAVFEKVKPEPGESPFNFLIKLAKDRGFLISSTATGKLLFRKAATNPRTTTLKQGHTPLLSVTPNINPQGYYSDITGLAPGSTIKDPESVTVNNTNLKVNRPFVYKVQQKLTGADLQNAVKWKIGLMIANAMKYSISVQGLRDEHGRIWETNTYINLTAPGAYVNNETTFIIKNLTLAKYDSEITTMNLVLPESYSGEIPKRLPWD